MTTDTKDRREAIASNVNGFLSGLGLPISLTVRADDVVLTDTGARVTAKFGDVTLAVDIGHTSLVHLAMISGFIGRGG